MRFLVVCDATHSISRAQSSQCRPLLREHSNLRLLQSLEMMTTLVTVVVLMVLEVLVRRGQISTISWVGTSANIFPFCVEMSFTKLKVSSECYSFWPACIGLHPVGPVPLNLQFTQEIRQR